MGSDVRAIWPVARPARADGCGARLASTIAPGVAEIMKITKNMIFRPENDFLEIAPNVTMDFSQASPTLPGLENVSIDRWNVPDDITWRHGWGGKSCTKVKKSSKITKNHDFSTQNRFF